jgi:hypothetical protein
MSTSKYRPESIDQITDITLNYTPGGRLLNNKYDKSTNVYKFFKSFSTEQYRVLTELFDINDGLFVKDSTKLIDEWERELGIPDTIFSGVGSLEERQNDVIVKRLLMNGNREVDYKAVADIYGMTIEIRTGAANAFFPLPFPLIFAIADEARNTMYIKFISTEPLALFPLPFPLEFSSGGDTIVKLKKVFDKMKPATTKIIYQIEEA